MLVGFLYGTQHLGGAAVSTVLLVYFLWQSLFYYADVTWAMVKATKSLSFASLWRSTSGLVAGIPVVALCAVARISHRIHGYDITFVIASAIIRKMYSKTFMQFF